MRGLVESNQYPQVLAWQDMRKEFDQPLAAAPYTGEVTMEFYTALIAQGSRARDLALAWWITGDDRYAQDALTYLRAWSSAEPAPGYTLRRRNGEMETRSGMYLGRAIFPMLAAADLLWDSHPGFDAALQNDFSRWMRQLEERIKESVNTWDEESYFGHQDFQNHLVAHDLGLAGIGSVLGDRDLLQYALDDKKNPRDVVELIEGIILMKGDPVHRRERPDAPAPQDGEIYDRYREHTAKGRGLQYSHLSLNLLAATAEVYRPLGVDLWNYRAPGGETLRLPFEFYADFFRLRDPAIKGGFYSGANHELFTKADTMAIFELGLARFPESDPLRQLVWTLDRPIHRDHVLGPLVLSHGLVFPGEAGKSPRPVWEKPPRREPQLTISPLRPDYPRLLLTMDDLDTIRRAIASGESPAVEVWEALRGDAKSFLNVSPKPYVGRDTGTFHRFALADARMARDLALTWRLGGDPTYAKRAAYILERWADARPAPATRFPNDPMSNNKGMLIGRSLLPMIWAFDLLADTPYLGAESADRFRAWLRELLPTITSAESIWEEHGYFDHQYVQNHQAGKLLGKLAIAIALGDEELYRESLDGADNPLAYTHLLENLILMPGDPVYYREPPGTKPPHAGEIMDRYRHFEMSGHTDGYVTAPLRGLQYCILSTHLLALCARMAEVNGTPLAGFTAPGGENLRLPFEFYAPMYATPGGGLSGGFYDGEAERIALPGAGDRPAVFELGHLLFPTSASIAAPLAQEGRATDTTILVGRDILLFGSLTKGPAHSGELPKAGKPTDH